MVATLTSASATLGVWTGDLGVARVAGAQRRSPSLLVVLVVDQFRADYLERYAHRWRGGFRTLLTDGAAFTRVEYPYLNTATCAGHATIATGTLPRTHGIILNRWWHRDEGRTFNCMDDDAASHLSYGAAAASGSSGKRLLVSTLADELRVQRPGARVVSLSLKARGAIPLAGRTGDAVLWFDEPAHAFVTSRAFADEPLPSIRAFLAREGPEADLGHTWALRDRGETYLHQDLGIGERPKAGWSALFPHTLKTGDAGAEFFDRWQKSPFSDALLSRLAVTLVDDLALGQRHSTDYLAISFSALDLMGHDFGPDSREVEDLLMHLDATLGALLQHLDARVGRDDYIVALSADHGTAPTPEQSGGGHIASEDLNHVVEQTLVSRWGPSGTGTYVAYGGSGSIWFSAGVFDRLRTDVPAMQEVTQALLRVPGVARVLRPGELRATSRESLVRAALAGYSPGRTADLLLVPKRNWVIEFRVENEATNHGTFHEYDRRVPLLLRGHGVRPGRYTGRVSPADIAPTLAHVAGITLPKAEGRVLREAIR